MWISFITTVIIRVPIAYTIAHLTKSEAYPTGRPESVFVSLLMAWVFGAIINLAFYKRGKWRKEGLVGEDSKEENKDKYINLNKKQVLEGSGK